MPVAGPASAHLLSSAPRAPGRLWWVALLVLALLLAQSLGVLHGVVHAPGVPGQGAQDHFAVQARHGTDGHHGHPAHSGADAPNLFERLFANHGEEADCRNYDQLSHGDVLTGFAPVVLPLALSPFVLSILPGLATARWHALFDARGPPALR